MTYEEFCKYVIDLINRSCINGKAFESLNADKIPYIVVEFDNRHITYNCAITNDIIKKRYRAFKRVNKDKLECEIRFEMNTLRIVKECIMVNVEEALFVSEEERLFKEMFDEEFY